LVTGRRRALADSLRTGLWLIPGLCVVAAVVLAMLLVQVDRGRDTTAGITFGAGASGAREVLSAITTSMITFTGLVFSITIVVLQLTSSQFSPRVLRTFLRDRVTQFSLGTFVATFVYSMTVLRTVRSEPGDEFVPELATTVAFALLLLSVMMFVAYIHHITTSIQVSSVLEAIGLETRRTIEARYPIDDVEQVPGGELLARDPTRTITASSSGVITSIDIARLVELASGCDVVVVIPHDFGTFVAEGTALAHVVGTTDGLDDDDVRAAVPLGRERTMQQDVAFGFRQLVDVAERALSPGINDPTTAVQSLDQIHDLLRRLVSRRLENGVHVDDAGAVRLVMSAMTCEDYLRLGLSEIAQYGEDSIQVRRKLDAMRDDLLDAARPEHRAAVAGCLERTPPS
jgi:uncharacterized membrane protein